MQQIITDENGQPLYAIELVPIDGPLRGAGGDTVTDAANNIRRVGTAIAESCSDIFSAVREGAQDALPDDLEVSFGVTLAGEAGLPWIKASGEAAFSVTARWNANR